MIISSILGVIVGLTLGLTGAGGGILAVPALVVGVGLPMTSAAPIALIAVGLAALTGAIDGLTKKLVRYKAAALMSIVGGLFSPIGVWLAKQLPEFWLMILFSGVMFFVAGRMYLQARRPTTATPQASETSHPATTPHCVVSDATGKFIWNTPCTLTIGGIGAVSGLLTGLLGVGGGFIIVPLLKRFTTLTMHGIVATSLMVIALISTVTVLNALATTDALAHAATWPFVGMVVAGMVAGRVVAPKLPAYLIQISFAVLCSVAALIVLLTAFGLFA